MIAVDHVSRKYGDVVAVDDVSFAIGAGEIVGLLGHNGAGKSTIMKMLTGYLEPSGGQVLIAGEELAGNYARAQRRIGYLPENCPVYADMSVVDFLEYTARLRGIEPGQRPGALRSAIERADLGEKAQAPIATLSRGYRQRVGVAQALLHNPEILILDEPTNGLDPGQIEHMRGLIKTLGRHATLLISTHILQEVEAVCDRVLILRHGRLALDAQLSELRGHGMLLSCDAAPEYLQATLEKLPALARIELLGESAGRFSYRLEPQPNQPSLAPAIAETVVSSGWQLFTLQPEEKSLEKLFHQITAGEVRQDAA